MYPALYEGKVPALVHLRGLLEKRTPKHRKGFYLWLLASPLTLPFALVRACSMAAVVLTDILKDTCSRNTESPWVLLSVEILAPLQRSVC